MKPHSRIFCKIPGTIADTWEIEINKKEDDDEKTNNIEFKLDGDIGSDIVLEHMERIKNFTLFSKSTCFVRKIVIAFCKGFSITIEIYLPK